MGFNPTQAGLFEGTVSFSTNDADEAPFNFVVAAVVEVQQAELDVWAAGGGNEGGDLSFVVHAPIPEGTAETISSIDIDINDDGQYDVSGSYDLEYRGLVLQNVDQLDRLGSPASRGEYTGALRIVWSDAYEEIYDLPITVYNSAPNVGLTLVNGSAGTAVTAIVQYSDYLPGNIVSISVDFGESVQAVSVGDTVATHTYTRPGSYLVTATVVDDAGATAEVTKWVDVDSAFSPHIANATFRLVSGSPDSSDDFNTPSNPIEGIPEIEVLGSDGSLISASDGSAIVWDTNGDGLFSPGGDETGNSVYLDSDVTGTFFIGVQITDPVNGAVTTAFYEFAADGMAVGDSREVQSIGQPGADLTQENVIKMFRLLWPEKESDILLKAFLKEGDVLLENRWWPLAGNSSLRYLTAAGNRIELSIHNGLTVPEAALELRRQLTVAAGYWNVQRHIVSMIGDSGDVEALITSYQSRAANAAATVATITELYIDGLTIFNSGLDVVISVAQASQLVEEGRPTLAIATLLPLAAPLVKQGGKVTLHIGGKLKHVPIEHVAWAEKYAEAVFDNKFTKWSDSLPDVPISVQSDVRKLAREMFPEIVVPISLDVPGYVGKRIANFDEWVFKNIPGTSPPSYLVDLPKVDPKTGKSLWSLGEVEHRKWLDAYFLKEVGYARPVFSDN